MIGNKTASAWRRARLTPVLYHFTFRENVKSILADRALIANKGVSICRNPDSFVCLSDRMTKGLVQFCGNIVFEFDAFRLYSGNFLLAPRDYGLSEEDTSRYEYFPFFENEWGARGKVEFELADINRVLFVVSSDCKKPHFRRVAQELDKVSLPYIYVGKSYLPDSLCSDTIRYFERLERWHKFHRSLVRKVGSSYD